MQLQRMLWFIMPLAVLCSCKKETHPSTPPSPAPMAPKVKTITAGNDIRNYFYDDKGRVLKIVYTLYGRDEFSYADTGIVDNYYDTTNKLISKNVYKLDSKGLAIAHTSSGSPSDNFTASYTSHNQLLKYTDNRNLPGITRRWDYGYFYTNDNLDSVITTYFDGTNTNSIGAYYDEYYTDKPNTLGNDNYGQAFLGASSKNPVKKARDLGSDNTGYMPTSTYVYEYDSQNRITIQKKYYEQQTGYTSITFTYY